MDIKKTIEDLLAKIQGDKSLINKFKSNPADTVRSLVGDNISLEDDQIKTIIDGIKAKLDIDSAKGILSKLFGKK